MHRFHPLGNARDAVLGFLARLLSLSTWTCNGLAPCTRVQASVGFIRHLPAGFSALRCKLSLLRGGQADFADRAAHTHAKLDKYAGSLFPLWSGRAGRFLQNHHRVGYTTEPYVGVAPGGATGVNGFAGCGRQPFGAAG